MSNTICWTDVPVVDLDRAIRFYSAVLGTEVKRETQNDFEFGLFPHFENGISGCLAKLENNPPSRTGPLVYFSADGRMGEAVEAVGQHGGEVLQPPHSIGPHGFRAIILDSEGNRVALHSRTA